jgi:mersacidin/lichenicidin family type 2 lantibiotic
MNINHIIRAWKDESYRLSLTAAEQAALPANPAGIVELSDAQLGAVNGAAGYCTQYCTNKTACSGCTPTVVIACRPTIIRSIG